MWARTQLKIGWADLLAGAAACVLPGSRERESARVESFWGDGRETMATYSVRSGFDLLLQSLGLEHGDEVIFSALNVRGMIKIVSRLGYTPVPVDLDIAHFAPRMDKLEQAISNRSRVLVVAHLFGTRIDLEPIVAFARRHNLVLVEDCAQVFDGRAYAGHPEADVNMFSFGPLKTSTALGGGLVRVRDHDLCERMRALQATHPVQPESRQFKRVAQFAALKVITSRFVMGQIYRFFHARGEDYEDAVSEKVRNVAPLGSSKKLRFQPSRGMLRLMARRVFNYREGSLEETAALGRRLRDLIGDSVVLPGQANTVHNYWVFPMLVDQPQVFIEEMRARGFDCANLPRSQAVPPPADRPDLEAKTAAQALSDLVVVPCYPGMPDNELVREAEAVREIASRVGSTRTRGYATVPAVSVDAA